MAQEVEIKLVAAAEDLENFPSVDLPMRSEVKGRKRVLSIYFDTPDFALRSLGIGFRVRQVDDGFLMTVKGKGVAVGGVHRREEYEVPIAGDMPDFTLLEQSPFAPIFAEPGLKERLKPVFTTDFMRNTVILSPQEGVLIEMVVDLGRVHTEDAETPLSEIELELKEGDTTVLLDTARVIAELLPTRLENISKAGRGYLLLGGVNFQPHTPKLEPLPQGAPRLDVFTAVLRHYLSTWQINEPAFVHGHDFTALNLVGLAIAEIHSCLARYAPYLPEFARRDLVHLADSLARDLRRCAGDADLSSIAAGVLGFDDPRSPLGVALDYLSDGRAAQLVLGILYLLEGPCLERGSREAWWHEPFAQ